MGGQYKEICKNGHIMAETRRVTPKGTPYCYKCKALYVKVYLKNNKHQASNSSWRWKLKKLYNLTEQKYIELYIEQKGNCAICSDYIEYRGFATHVDHCHNNNNVRALLCSNCNTALGLMKDNVEIMAKAIKYIKKHKDK